MNINYKSLSTLRCAINNKSLSKYHTVGLGIKSNHVKALKYKSIIEAKVKTA
jgi:hypothetical protein